MSNCREAGTWAVLHSSWRINWARHYIIFGKIKMGWERKGNFKGDKICYMIPDAFSLFSLWLTSCHQSVVCLSICWFRPALSSCYIVFVLFSGRLSTIPFTFGLSCLLILTFLIPIWLTFCLHLFRCSQQQWPSSRLVRPRCQVSFCILPAVHSILQLSRLRSRGGKSAAKGERERGEEEGRNKIIVHPVTDWSGSHSRHTNNSRQLVTSH